MADLEEAFATMTRERVGGFVTGPHDMFVLHRARIADLAVKHRVPGVYELREQAEAGGLLAYGPSASELFARAADQAAKILRGAKPALVPIEQPAKLELIVNRKTARLIGLTIPQTILVRADDVID